MKIGAWTTRKLFLRLSFSFYYYMPNLQTFKSINQSSTINRAEYAITDIPKLTSYIQGKSSQIINLWMFQASCLQDDSVQYDGCLLLFIFIVKGYNFIEELMSYLPYYSYYRPYYYPYYDPLLYRTSYVQAELAASRLRRSRIQADIATQSAIRRSRVEAEIARTQSALRRSRVQAEIETSSAIRRSRLQAEIAASRAATESVLRRSRVQAQVATETALRRSRVQAQLAYSRRTVQDDNRRKRVQQDVQRILLKY